MDEKELCPNDHNLFPKVDQYAPYMVPGLVKGEVKLWCRCGLSKKQPWCDASHAGTGFTPLKWTVPVTQHRYYICGCKYTKSEPLCDGRHTDIPCVIKKCQENCSQKQINHIDSEKLCTNCGWIPDF